MIEKQFFFLVILQFSKECGIIISIFHICIVKMSQKIFVFFFENFNMKNISIISFYCHVCDILSILDALFILTRCSRNHTYSFMHCRKLYKISVCKIVKSKKSHIVISLFYIYNFRSTQIINYNKLVSKSKK